MALEAIWDRVTGPSRRAENLAQQERELLQTRNQLEDILTREGVEKPHVAKDIDDVFSVSDVMAADFTGDWEGVDTEVRIYKKHKSLLFKNSLFVDISMGGARTLYTIKKRVGDSKADIYSPDGLMIDRKPSEFCLGLSQVVEAIQGGQLTIVKE